VARKPTKSTTLKQLDDILKRCARISEARYVTPTIHPGFRLVTAIDIHTSRESREFTITNNPDPEFDLAKAVNEYLDELEANQNGIAGT
jgi:hypothetical protein